MLLMAGPHEAFMLLMAGPHAPEVHDCGKLQHLASYAGTSFTCEPPGTGASVQQTMSKYVQPVTLLVFLPTQEAVYTAKSHSTCHGLYTLNNLHLLLLPLQLQQHAVLAGLHAQPSPLCTAALLGSVLLPPAC